MDYLKPRQYVFFKVADHLWQRVLTFDQAAIHIILSPVAEEAKKKVFDDLDREACIAEGNLCPACGEEDALDWNEVTGSACTYLCLTCEHQWSPNEG